MTQVGKIEADDQGVTMISGILGDARGFYARLLTSGLRLSLSPVPISLHTLPDGALITAQERDCTGYLLAADGIEASESDLYRFLHAELAEGQGINVFGRYAPDEGKLIQSMAHYRHVEGRIMCSERRVLHDGLGGVELLRSRSDIEHDNVVPLRRPSEDPDPFL